MNEIRSRAIAFANEYRYDSNEEAEGKAFIDAFFDVFGISRRRVASFEYKVKKIDGKDGYIDLLWKGIILIEQKSKGKDLDRAHEQAKDYFPGLKDNELPRYILVSDFARFRLYDLDEGKTHEFWLIDLSKNIHLFGFMTGHQRQLYPPQDPVNIKAAEMMGKLHDQLKKSEYTGHELEVLLVRLLFCLFADDTTIFEKNSYREYVEKHTKEDGTDLGPQLEIIFQILNTPEGKRFKNLDEDLAGFPYVNGKLFEERLPIASFDSSMRKTLLDCAALDWGRISPAIFGSLFQSVMNPIERRSLGAHYTEEENIMKVVRSLFLNDLRDEFNKAKYNRKRLDQLQEKLSTLQFLDPACGCGNFLVIAYREIRQLEIEILQQNLGDEYQQVLDVAHLSKVNVDQFYGIEIEEFPAQIAQVAMWLMDHQMNMILSNTFGLYYRRLPLVSKPNIICDNALKAEWKDIANPCKLSYILGNPPFGGSRLLSEKQQDEMSAVFVGVKNYGVLDYVSAWYKKAGEYIQGTNIKVGFVSTNSITQGEQVGPLWDLMLNKFRVNIHFAHRTFRWISQARGKAAVHCVIIGFSLIGPSKVELFDYATPESEPHLMNVKRINPYLVDAPDILITNRSKPICNVPNMVFGSMPIDDGNFLFTDEEKIQFIMDEPQSEQFFKPLISAREFLHNEKRWCLWLKDVSPTLIKNSPMILERIQKVKVFREASKRNETRELASTPYLFGFINLPDTNYVLTPLHSSETRKYIPMGFFTSDHIANNSCAIIPGATLFHFGIIMSSMHMAWVRSVCGRIKSDYRYSIGIVYNNFPWPFPTDQQKQSIENAAKTVLDARSKYSTSSLADLYDPLTMPKELVMAHNNLDALVEKAYGKRFVSDVERVSFLFDQYSDIVSNAKKINGG